MQKVITVRYAGKCKSCRGVISAGSRAYWLGKGAGMRHISCPDSSPSPTPKTPDAANYTFTKSFAELRDAFRKFAAGDNSLLTMPSNRKEMDSLRTVHWSDTYFSGGSISETLEWLDSGFIVEGLAGVDSTLFPARPRRKIRYSEEGDEMLIDLVLSGVDEHFIEWEKRIQKPGLKVEIGMCFSASMRAEVIVKYQRWVARMLNSLDTAGIDCEIDLVSLSRSTYRGEELSEARVNVKRAGESADFGSWSAMFSPTGYRHLVFMHQIQGADFHGFTASGSLGYPITPNEFSVDYDEESNVLKVGNTRRADEFPEFEMTERFKAILTRLGG